MLEDSAYRRLLDVYYSTEKPLPKEHDKVCRLIRAKSRQEKKSVVTILQEFFLLRSDGWINKRADQEIAKYKDKTDKARQSAAVRWDNERNANAMRTHSEGNAPITRTITNKEQEHVGSRKNGARHALIDESPVIQTLPLVDGTDFEVRQSFVAELEPLYPLVDIASSLPLMKGWLIAKPQRRKTRRGIKAFITSWLAREQTEYASEKPAR